MTLFLFSYIALYALSADLDCVFPPLLIATEVHDRDHGASPDDGTTRPIKAMRP